MLICARSFEELCFDKLMGIYLESNRENAGEFYPDETPEQGTALVVAGFHSFLREDFFRRDQAQYWILTENGEYLAALRLEKHRDGLLLEALETRPDFRRQGAAKRLIQSVFRKLPEGTIIYSHVSRRNEPSLRTHRSCGFVEYPDQENLPYQVTMRFAKNKS